MSDLLGSADGQPSSGRANAKATAPGPMDDGLHRGTVDSDRLRRRARFLREMSEARALRERVQPRRARVARMRQQMRMRTFRW